MLSRVAAIQSYLSVIAEEAEGGRSVAFWALKTGHMIDILIRARNPQYATPSRNSLQAEFAALTRIVEFEIEEELWTG